MRGSHVTLSKSTLALFPVWRGIVEGHLLPSCSSPKWLVDQEKKNQTDKKCAYFQSDIKTNFPF